MSLPRIDRLCTLYFFHPLRRILHPLRTGHISILMYHNISDSKEKAAHPYYLTNTSPEIFARQLDFLHENGYSVIGLQDVIKHLKSTEKIRNKYVVITFDDGYRDFYTNAFPILKKYGFSATVFLPTVFISDRELKLKGKEHLSWDEVQKLRSNGITFGSHTATHPQLQSLSEADVEHELSRSKETIEDKLGEEIDSFSYPFAFPEGDKRFTERLKKVLRRNGYKYGVSTRIGTTSNKDDIYFMKRIPVNSCDDIALFKAKLEGGYDWLHRPQYIFKSFKKPLK